VPNDQADYFLPDLCNAQAIVYLLAFGEGLVAVLTLMETGLESFSWERFGLVSLFVQWVALLSVALICQLRNLTFHMKPFWVSVMGIGIVTVVTAMVSLVASYLGSDFDFGMDWHWIARNLVVAAVVTAFLMRYFYVQSQWRLRSQAELKARLSALQAHIRPHFFFNSLNTVASLIVTDPEKAESMLLDLAQLFRVVLQADAEPTTLETDLELGRRYLDIEATRLGERVTLEWDLPKAIPRIKLPVLTIQPIMENAIYHGIQPLVKGGLIRVSLFPQAQQWCLLVENDCPDQPSKTRLGLAQMNIRARLEAYFGGSARLTTEQSGTGYKTLLILPHPTEETHEH
jgi:two-component system sensor histidine kinase AlgZ